MKEQNQVRDRQDGGKSRLKNDRVSRRRLLRRGLHRHRGDNPAVARVRHQGEVWTSTWSRNDDAEG